MWTWIRRLCGLAFIALGVAIYLDSAVRGSFSCERAAKLCVHSVERVIKPAATRPIPLADVLGAYYQWSYWEEAPNAREILARARTIEDVQDVFVSRPGYSRSTSQRPVVYTRQGLVPLIPEFTPGSAPIHELNNFVRGDTRERFVLVQDERFTALPLPVLLLLLGSFLVVLRSPRPARA